MKPLFIESNGSGQALVLVHGFCEDHRIWQTIVPQLAGKHRVITVDMPGFGKSELDEEQEINTLEQMADRLQETLKKEGVEKCALIGHSMGGYLTLAFAEKYPEMLNGIGLFHSTAYADDDEKKANRLKQADFVKNNGVEPFVKTLIPTLFSSEHDYKSQTEASLQMAKECSAAGIINALKAMRQRPERLNILKQLQVPALFIAGKYDGVVPVEKVSYQASLPLRAQFELFDKSGHMGMVEEPARSIEAINLFMDFIAV